ARSEAQTSASYSTIGVNALKWVPLLKIIFETIYYGAFPLAMLLMMTPLVWTVIKGYFGGFVWLAAWDPLSAILHSTLMGRSAGYYREAMGTFNGSNIDYVMSFANQFGIRAVQQDVSTVAGYLMMSVPFIATIIFFGAGRMAGLATSFLNVGQGAAMEAGRETATGNISLANASMNNMAANKYNTSSLYDTGLATRRLADGALHHRNADGSQTYSTGTAQTTSGMSARVGQTIREEVSDRKDAAIRTATSARDEWSTAVNETAADYADFGRSLSSGTSVGNDASSTSNLRSIKEAREAHQAVEDFSKQHGISVDAAYKIALTAGTPGSKVLGGNATAELVGVDRDSYDRISKAARESGLSESVSKFAEASHSVRAGQQSSETNTESGGNRWSMEDVRRMGNTYAEAREEAETLSAAEANLYSKGINYDQQLTDAVIDEWRQAGFSDEQITGFLNPKTTKGVLRQEKAVEQVLPGLLEDLGLDKPTPDLTSAFTLSRPQQEITTQQLPSSGTEHRAEHQRVTDATKKLEGAISDRQQVLEGKATGKAASHKRQVVEGQDFGVIPGIGYKLGTTGADVWDSTKDAWNGAFGASNLTNYDRDVMIRTIHGEAGRQSDLGQAAVAHVIMNRVADDRWGDNPAEVSLQLKQFSAWNSGVGGNSLPTKLEEGSEQYERIGRIVDAVAAGEIEDPTGGATHYYSPAGMRAHVEAGEQSNEIPTWLSRETNARGGENVRIGGHVFTGRRRDE
uniref:conjugal transfer protein TraG N-terminal domain-containing protein n=1 Tax=Ruegeria sp. HKCCD8929 TaxID=2683006 RepID=UPI00148787A2